MAFTRSFLKTIGLTDEQVQTIMEEHVNVTDALKKFKEDAEKLPSVQKELDKLKKDTADYDEWKKKYNDEHSAFEAYKTDVANKEQLAKAQNAYRSLLKTAKVDEKRFDSILKLTDFTEKKLGDDGKFANEKELLESIQKEWSDFIVTSGERSSHKDAKPLDNDRGGLDEDANAKYIRERAARRHAGIYGDTPKE